MTMNSTERHVVVVGGGVIGTSCAYFLMRSGWRVTLIDRARIGRGSSHGNCGLVCPSHILPLAEPGMVAKGVKSLFERNSPFAIKPRFDPALWSWLLHFAARCNHPRYDRSRPCASSPCSSPRCLSTRISLSASRSIVSSRHADFLFAYRSREQMDSYAATDRLLGESFHCVAERYDGDALTELEPALRTGLAGGWFYHDDAHLRPDKLMQAWRRVIEAGGVTVRENCGCKAFAVATAKSWLPYGKW